MLARGIFPRILRICFNIFGNLKIASLSLLALFFPTEQALIFDPAFPVEPEVNTSLSFICWLYNSLIHTITSPTRILPNLVPQSMPKRPDPDLSYTTSHPDSRALQWNTLTRWFCFPPTSKLNWGILSLYSLALLAALCLTHLSTGSQGTGSSSNLCYTPKAVAFFFPAISSSQKSSPW